MNGLVFISLSLVLVLLVDCRPQPTDQRTRRRSHHYDAQVRPEANRRHDDISYVFDGEILHGGEPIPLVNPTDLHSRSPGSTSIRNRGEINPNQRSSSRTQKNDDDNDVIGYQETRIVFSKAPEDTSGMQRDGDFVFPEDPEDHKTVFPTSDRFKPVLTSSCRDTFCEETNYYPGDYVVNVIGDKISAFKDLLYDDIHSVKIGQRIDANDEMPLCQSREDIVYPKVAKNDNEEWLYIVNEGSLKQGVRVEMCLSDPQSCQLASSFPSGYEGLCKQKFIYRKMVAIDPKGDAVQDNFKLPSCCTCYYKKTLATLTKFGAKSSPARKPS